MCSVFFLTSPPRGGCGCCYYSTTGEDLDTITIINCLSVPLSPHHNDNEWRSFLFYDFQTITY